MKGCQTLIQTAEKNEFFPYQVIFMPLVLSSIFFFSLNFFVCLLLPMVATFASIFKHFIPKTPLAN